MPATAAALERAMRFQEVILKATSGKMSWIQAADVLGLSPRTLRRWRIGYERYGLKGLQDRRRVDRAHNGVRESEIKRWLQLYERRYRGYNVRHFYSKLKREHGGCRWSYTVVRRALQFAGLVKKKRPRGRHFIRREPRPCFGEMLHIDGSRHHWLTLEPDQWFTLVPVVDDATKRLLYAQLFESETTEAIMTALAAVIRCHGIPQSLYSDRAGWATYTVKAGQPIDRTRLTQVGRALHQLGVEHIMAYSPQARGRSERANRTLQDRLVKELESHGIRTLARANRYLEEVFLPAFNDEFARRPAESESGFAPLGSTDLDRIFCHFETRQVQRDNTITLDGVRMQIPRQVGRRTCAGLSVDVHRHLDGTHTLYWGAKLFGRYGPQGRALSKEPLVHPAIGAPVAVA
jgi:Helix-turn-helix domain